MFELIAPTTFGVEKLVKKELMDLGFYVTAVENGAVYFDADAEGVCKANICLGISNRVFLKMGVFEAQTFDELFDNTKAIDWAKIISIDGEFPVVKVSSVKSQLFAKSSVQSIVKKAVVKSLFESYKTNELKETGPQYPIHVKILKDRVTLSIDTSGASLNKRGYRSMTNNAPLRETLAAAIVAIADVDFSTQTLYDPLCGSGTILIEAAMQANNIAPGLKRDFISEQWPIIDSKYWKLIREQASQIIEDNKINIVGSDISGRVIKIARENAKAAGVDKDISFFHASIAETTLERVSSSQHERPGTIICNPPYGERMFELKETEDLYKEMGKVFQEHFKDWNYFILTSHPDFEKLFGRRADKKRKLYNGKIECHLYQYFS